jgi:hypothetical protein
MAMVENMVEKLTGAASHHVFVFCFTNSSITFAAISALLVEHRCGRLRPRTKYESAFP